MKKLMIAVLMVLSTSAVFAGNSPALKAILNAKTFAEAQNLLNSSLNQLADNEEKATAYNKLVDLAMQKVSKEQAIMTNNQLAQQLKTGKVQPYDTVGFDKAVYEAIVNGLECEKYDIMPNEKGKVKPKFHTNNQNRLYSLRTNLINSGQTAGQANDTETALKHFGLYVESADNSLFKEVDRTKNPDIYLGQVARVAAVYSYQNKDLDKANKYVDIAMKDTATYKDALNLKIYMASQGLKTKEDSLKFANTLKELYDKDSQNDMVFGQLAALYGSVGKKAEANAMIEKRLAEDPNNYTAWSLKGQNLMGEGKFDDAITAYKKAISIKDDDALIFAYIGYCFNSKAAASQNAADQKALLTESLKYLEKSRSLDPNRERANWAYPLYQCYYTIYGAEDSRTKELESLIK